MRVLITNLCTSPRNGSVLYMRDLALELQRQGHTPEIFSLPQGEIAQEMRGAGIPVESSLRKLHRPDVIHGHHYAPTLAAVRHWRDVPAISICHDYIAADDRAPLHASIMRYFGVSVVCVARQISEGVPPSDTGLLLNFVDTARFEVRGPLPARPRRALLFSNYANAATHLPAVVEACKRAGLELDVMGSGAGNSIADPERVLPQYDIVFAKAKAAMEAMAVGAAVVLCDYAGAGPMVTSANFDELRPLNFGFQALTDPLSAESILRQIERYDPADAAKVRDRVRADAGLDRTVRELIDIYRGVIGEYSRISRGSRERRYSLQALRDQLLLRVLWARLSMPASSVVMLQRIGVSSRVRGLVRKALGAGLLPHSGP